jgi:hypothetical protein
MPRWISSPGRLGEELKLFHALAQLIEYSDTTLVQRAAINRWFDSVRAPVEKPQSHGVLNIGNCFGNGRLRHSEISGGLSHAARFDDREQDVQVA